MITNILTKSGPADSLRQPQVRRERHGDRVHGHVRAPLIYLYYH